VLFSLLSQNSNLYIESLLSFILLQALFGKRLMDNAGNNNYEISIYKGLGHLVDLPFSPPTTVSNHALFPKPFKLVMGGDNVEQHGQAQEKIWTQLLNYFKKHLF
jgi:hypothetical protein